MNENDTDSEIRRALWEEEEKICKNIEKQKSYRNLYILLLWRKGAGLSLGLGFKATDMFIYYTVLIKHVLIHTYLVRNFSAFLAWSCWTATVNLSGFIGIYRRFSGKRIHDRVYMKLTPEILKKMLMKFLQQRFQNYWWDL